MLLLTFSSLGNSVHLTPVIHTFVTSSMNPCNWSGIWNLWMDTEGDCWLFPWWNVLLAEYVWIQVPQKASTFSQYLFTALATIFKASKEISETAAYLWCALDHRFKKKKTWELFTMWIWYLILLCTVCTSCQGNPAVECFAGTWSCSWNIAVFPVWLGWEDFFFFYHMWHNSTAVFIHESFPPFFPLPQNKKHFMNVDYTGHV